MQMVVPCNNSDLSCKLIISARLHARLLYAISAVPPPSYRRYRIHSVRLLGRLRQPYSSNVSLNLAQTEVFYTLALPREDRFDLPLPPGCLETKKDGKTHWVAECCYDLNSPVAYHCFALDQPVTLRGHIYDLNILKPRITQSPRPFTTKVSDGTSHKHVLDICTGLHLQCHS